MAMMRRLPWLAAMALLLGAMPARAQNATRWIESWGTAQPLLPPAPPPPALRGARPAAAPPFLPYPETLTDQTVRMIVRTSAGGAQIRLEFSNVMGAEPVTFGAVHAALAGREGAIVPGSDRTVRFGGKPGLTLFPGARAVSDPIDLAVPALTEIAVSIHVPGPAPTNSVHALGLRPAYIVPGDRTGAQTLEAPQIARSYFWLRGLSVPAASAEAGTIVAFGDSITDGYGTTPGRHAEWPALLAERLQQRPATAGMGVVNAGISGNRILRPGAGEAAVARFDADVLSRPGVKWVLFLEGINDINMSIMPMIPDSEAVTAEQIIAGIGQIIDRAHQHGIRIAGGTILPTKGLPFYSAEGEAMRQAVNRWIRTSGRFDAVIDFDAATRDPADPLRLRPDFDPGDHVHPNDAGNRAMADAIDLALFP
jgi:lysophospholipase L1-like esterase